MRAIWKGAVSFGLVSIPVKLYTATEEKDVSFHQVHREDGGRIRYKRVCQIDGEEVAYDDIAKGYELPSGETVVLTDEDFADLPLTSSRVVDVLSFVPLEQVDPIYFAKTYYLEPEKNATKPYVLLRDALEQADSVALVKVAIRTRGAAGHAAGARRRAGAGDDGLAGRGARPGLRLPRRGRDGPPAGAGDGRVADREHDRRLRPGPVPRRLPGGAARRSSRPRSRAARWSSSRSRRRTPARSSTSWRRCGPRSRRPRRAAARPTRRSRRRRRHRPRRHRRRRPPQGAGQEDGRQEGPGQEGRGEEVGVAPRRAGQDVPAPTPSPDPVPDTRPDPGGTDERDAAGEPARGRRRAAHRDLPRPPDAGPRCATTSRSRPTPRTPPTRRTSCPSTRTTTSEPASSRPAGLSRPGHRRE